MLSPQLQRFIEETRYAFVASADQRARPHLAVARELTVTDGGRRVVFDSWVCPRTLENIAEVPRMALAVVDAATAQGYQLEGFVEAAEEMAMPAEYVGLPQVRARIEMRVEAVYELSAEVHNDRPLGLDA